MERNEKLDKMFKFDAEIKLRFLRATISVAAGAAAAATGAAMTRRAQAAEINEYGLTVAAYKEFTSVDNTFGTLATEQSPSL